MPSIVSAEVIMHIPNFLITFYSPCYCYNFCLQLQKHPLNDFPMMRSARREIVHLEEKVGISLSLISTMLDFNNLK